MIFVVDSTDIDRFPTVAEELAGILNEEAELKDAALLVFANKQDSPHAITPAELSNRLNLTHLKNRNWSIRGSSALKGEGLTEGLDWLVNIINEKHGVVNHHHGDEATNVPATSSNKPTPSGPPAPAPIDSVS